MKRVWVGRRFGTPIDVMAEENPMQNYVRVRAVVVF